MVSRYMGFVPSQNRPLSCRRIHSSQSFLLTIKPAVEKGGKEVWFVCSTLSTLTVWPKQHRLITLRQFSWLKFKAVTILASSSNSFSEESIKSLDRCSPQLNHWVGPFSSKMAPEMTWQASTAGMWAVYIPITWDLSGQNWKLNFLPLYSVFLTQMHKLPNSETFF